MWTRISTGSVHSLVKVFRRTRSCRISSCRHRICLSMLSGVSIARWERMMTVQEEQVAATTALKPPPDRIAGSGEIVKRVPSLRC
jgi:hypothetical protein